jgi:hypothetical protein
METQVPPTSADTSQLAIIQKKLFLDSKARNGLNWYFWIAGLSLVNTIMYLLGNSLTFVIGLGATQIVDGFMYALAKEINTGGNIVRLIGFAIDIFIAGIFVAIGVLGRKGYRVPIIIGMVLYAIDGIILLLFQDFFGAGFHAYALFGIWNGLKSASELASLEKDGNSESIESIRKRMPSLQPQVTPQQKRTRWILVGMILLVPIILMIIISFQQ